MDLHAQRVRQFHVSGLVYKRDLAEKGGRKGGWGGGFGGVFWGQNRGQNAPCFWVIMPRIPT